MLFLGLVVVDRQRFVVNSDVLLGSLCLAWRLEADKREEFFGLTGREHPQAVDFAVLGEQHAKLVLLHALWEALHVQIAALL